MSSTDFARKNGSADFPISATTHPNPQLISWLYFLLFRWPKK